MPSPSSSSSWIIAILLLLCLSTISAIRPPTPTLVTGEDHACTLLQTFTIHCWGKSGTFSPSSSIPPPSTPPSTSTSPSTSPSLAASRLGTLASTPTGSITCGILASGTNILCQGNNNWNSLSSPSTTDLFLTLSISPSQLCATLTSGRVICWRGTTSRILSISRAVQVVTSDTDTCVLSSTGSVTCWDNNNVMRTLPATDYTSLAMSPTGITLGTHRNGIVEIIKGTFPAVPTSITGAITVSIGVSHACVINFAGNIACWGNDTVSTTPSWSYTSTAGDDYVAVSASATFTCAMTRSGVITCWGRSSAVPVSFPTPLTSSYRSVTVSTSLTTNTDTSACAIDTTGKVVCIGNNINVPTLPSPATSLTLSNAGIAIILGDGKLWFNNGIVPSTSVAGINVTSTCFARSSQLCYLQATGVVTCLDNTLGITSLLWTGSRYLSIACTPTRICGLLENSTVACSTSGNSTRTVSLSSASERLASLAASDQYICGITDAGVIVCKDNNGSPSLPFPTSDRFSQVCVTETYACAITTTGAIRCSGSGVVTSAPGGFSFTSLSCTSHTACAISRSGEWLCWGSSVTYINPRALVLSTYEPYVSDQGVDGPFCSTPIIDSVPCHTLTYLVDNIGVPVSVPITVSSNVVAGTIDDAFADGVASTTSGTGAQFPNNTIYCGLGSAYSPVTRNCSLCTPGTYSDTGYREKCLLCPHGATSGIGAASCTACPPNTIAPVAGSPKCLSCGNHTTANPLRTFCVCPVGYTSPPSSTSPAGCIPCPHGSECPLGTTFDDISASPGYWRANNMSLSFHQCLISTQCLGGHDSTCAPNREGVLCASCSAGHHVAFSNAGCTPCRSTESSTGLSLILIAVVLAGLILMLLFVIKGHRLFALKHLDAEWEIRASRANSAGEVEVTANSKIMTPELRNAPHALYSFMILASFFQIALSISFLPYIPWPSFFRGFITGFSFLNIDIVPYQSLQCATPINQYDIFLIAVLTPPILIGLITITCLIPMWMWDKHRRTRDHMDGEVYAQLRDKHWKQFFAMCLFVLYLLYPYLCSRIVSLFICTRIESSGTDYLVADFSLECYTSRWRSWVAAAGVCFFIYCIGIPLLFYKLLRRNYDTMLEYQTRRWLGFAYDAYDETRWYWIVIDCAHKLILTGLIAFFPQDYQLGAGMVISLAYGAILLFIHPYVRRGDDELALTAQYVLFLLFLAGRVLSILQPSDLADNDSLANVALSVIMIALVSSLVFVFFYRTSKLLYKSYYARKNNRAAGHRRKESIAGRRDLKVYVQSPQETNHGTGPSISMAPLSSADLGHSSVSIPPSSAATLVVAPPQYDEPQPSTPTPINSNVPQSPEAPPQAPPL